MEIFESPTGFERKDFRRTLFVSVFPVLSSGPGAEESICQREGEKAGKWGGSLSKVGSWKVNEPFSSINPLQSQECREPLVGVSETPPLTVSMSLSYMPLLLGQLCCIT